MAAAGVMSDEDAIRTVRQRGILMQGEVPVGQGAMSAVLAMDAEKIEEVIAPIEGVQIANYNCPGQIVISGKTEAVAEAGESEGSGRKRVLPLKGKRTVPFQDVSGSWREAWKGTRYR